VRRRHLTRLLTVAAGCLAASSVVPSGAAAIERHFCVSTLVYSGPANACEDWQIRDWDRTRNRYAGHKNDNVVGCVFQRNVNAGNQLRGGRDWCDYTWSSPTLNPMGHNYGTTTVNQYTNGISNGTPYPHTFTGWASTNQTDG
jgi:hypothetical protein